MVFFGADRFSNPACAVSWTPRDVAAGAGSRGIEPTIGQRLVAAVGAAALLAAALAPVEARAQFGGYGGSVLGGVIAGSVIANSGPRVVYGRPRVIYTRPRVVYARPRVAAARPAPRRAAAPAAPHAATIDAGADPFAGAKPAGTIPVAAKP